MAMVTTMKSKCTSAHTSFGNLTDSSVIEQDVLEFGMGRHEGLQDRSFPRPFLSLRDRDGALCLSRLVFHTGPTRVSARETETRCSP